MALSIPVPKAVSGAALRAGALEMVVLGGHLLLYPTGVFQEKVAAAPRVTRPRATHPPGADPHATDPREPDPHATGLHAPGLHAPDPPAPGLHATHPAATRPPVLLLHGFTDNRSVFVLLRRALGADGLRHVEAYNYSPFTRDLRVTARHLARRVEELCERTGQERVDLVGHSLGGLVGRYYVQRLGGDARIRTLVTLGTPHSGTRVAPFLNAHPLVRQMRPGSEVLAELAAPAPGCATRCVAFWSEFDAVMSPVGTARIEHPDLRVENVQVTGIGHLALAAHPTVIAAVRRALDGTARAVAALPEAASVA